MRDNLLGRLSHEIRTPMNAIIGLGHLFQQTRLDEQQRQYLTKILSSANDLLSILQEMLEFSKIEEGGLELDSLPFELKIVMINLAREMELRCQEKGLAFTYSIGRDVPLMLMGDPIRLSQVLFNVVGNAVKFTENGSVDVMVEKVEYSPPHVILRFTITDTGIGMELDNYPRIFEPYMQGDNSNTRRYGGMGLGLASSARLVELMGGNIAASSNPNGGSVFSFMVTLKVAKDIPMPGHAALTNLRVLVVDDSLLSQQVAASCVSALGALVDTAESGKEALHCIRDADAAGSPYGAILLDWRMPEMDGIETASRIRTLSLRSGLPALVMHSDYDITEVKSRAKEAGILSFVPKPATPAIFQDAIMDALKNNTHPTTLMYSYGKVPHVLLVEDNDINKEIACELLKMARVEVDTASNGQEALEAVKNKDYALIFMDVQMPVMDGLEATRRLRSAGYTMPVIAMTAHAMLGDKDISLSAGMNDHLTKPLTPEALFATMNQWLAMTAVDEASTIASNAPPVGQMRHKKLPERIKGFNLMAGLAAVGGNEELYANLLSKFAARYATITEDITASLKAHQMEDALRMAHTVRGIAANLGAEDLAEAAGMLEKNITANPNMIEPNLNTLVMCIADATTAVRTALGYDNQEDNHRPQIAVSDRLGVEELQITCKTLDNAISHMEKDWGRANAISQYLLQLLQGTMLEEKATKLAQAVEDFEVSLAEQYHVELQEQLRLYCIPPRT